MIILISLILSSSFSSLINTELPEWYFILLLEVLNNFASYSNNIKSCQRYQQRFSEEQEGNLPVGGRLLHNKQVWKELCLPNFCQEVLNGVKVHLLPNFCQEVLNGLKVHLLPDLVVLICKLRSSSSSSLKFNFVAPMFKSNLPCATLTYMLKFLFYGVSVYL
ncbi:hypothetical protein ACTFIW_003820 [Dictyostelium discoideum]